MLAEDSPPRSARSESASARLLVVHVTDARVDISQHARAIAGDRSRHQAAHTGVHALHAAHGHGPHGVVAHQPVGASPYANAGPCRWLTATAHLHQPVRRLPGAGDGGVWPFRWEQLAGRCATGSLLPADGATILHGNPPKLLPTKLPRRRVFETRSRHRLESCGKPSGGVFSRLAPRTPRLRAAAMAGCQ